MSRLQALILLVSANVLWGSSHAIGKLAIDSFDPLILAGIRVSIATGCFWGLRISGISPREGVPRRDVLVLGSLGLLTVACAQFLDYRGLSLTTATDSSLMIIGEVIGTTVLAWLFAREFISPQKRIGLVLGIVGVVVLTLGGAPDSIYAPNRALGNTFVLLALLCESIFTVLGAHYVQRFQPLTILRWTYTGSMLVWLPVLWWAYSTNQIASASWEAWGAVVYMAVATSVVSYLLWFWVIRSAGASLGAISLFVQPVIGSFIGLYILAEPQSPGLYIGAALILAAMLVAALADRPPTAPTSADTV
jgi:drug/metabolite transporter (DMT)-like permease